MSRLCPVGLVPLGALALPGLLLGQGVTLYRGYGISWDEITNHNPGNVTANYLTRRLVSACQQLRFPTDLRIAWLPTSGIIHGSVVETPAAVLGQLLYTWQPRGYYAVRYRFAFLVFVAGVVALYGLGRLRFHSRGWVLLVLSPRSPAEAFYSGKDVGFTALFTVTILVLAMLARRPGTLGCGCRASSFPDLPWAG